MRTGNFLVHKRWAVAALVALLVISSAVYVTPTQAQGTPECPIRITMFATLIVHAAPSYASAVTTQLTAGQIVCMIGRNGSATWVQLAWPAPTSTVVGWAPASAFTTTVPITVLAVTDGSTPPVVTPPPVTPPPTTGQTYVVQPGDYLYRIAQRFGVTLSSLIQANNEVPPYIIYAGQVLVIPGTGGPTTPPGYTQYVVKAGDYLVSIARQYNLNWATLATVNGIAYPYIIYPGQTLLIPASG
jgi:LysM repeat protein